MDAVTKATENPHTVYVFGVPWVRVPICLPLTIVDGAADGGRQGGLS